MKIRQCTCVWSALFKLIVLPIGCSLAWLAEPVRAEGFPHKPLNSDYARMIEDDWMQQEKRLGRMPEDAAAIQAVWQGAEKLLDNLAAQSTVPDLEEERKFLATTRLQVNEVPELPAKATRDLYCQIRWTIRSLALKNPLLAGQPLVFMKRNRFVCQMLHEYLGYYYDYGDLSGGGVFVLEKPGISAEIRELTANRFPKGNFTTLALDYDGQTVYFAFAERAPAKPDYYSADRRCFHLFAMDAAGNNLRQLTTGPDDDFDPCPLPDGALAFMSTRRGGFGRCHNPWEPLPTYTLHRLEGGQVRTLSYHETNEWHPFTLNDGRIVYTRWDYVDRSAANFHGLWISNPDGSNPVSLFGNYTTRINACYQPHAVPGSDCVVFVAGAHHADVGGSLVMVDPKQVALDPQNGEDSFSGVERLTPEVCFPEAPGWPKSYFHSPWPLSKNHFLAAFSFDPLPGMGPGEKRDTRTGLYYLDRFGNLELLYRDPSISSMYPIPLQARTKPPMIPSTLDSGMGEEGEFLVTDVRRSFQGLPPGRAIKELRVFQVLPKNGTHVANHPRIGHANAESARMLLGSIPVETDGSAYFRVPARKPVYFQAVDAEGRAVQTMRSITYLQPGERRGCVGCHETPGAASGAVLTLAGQRSASRLEPGPDGTKPISFSRLIQPILDQHCVTCHGGNAGAKAKLALTAEPAGEFTQAYVQLKPFLRWHEWGEASISQVATRPGRQGSSESPLIKILRDSRHNTTGLTAVDWRQFYLWLDANAPFYGTYLPAAHLAQKQGKTVPPPELQ